MPETISALLFAGSLAIVACAFASAAWCDVRSFTIPNRICALIGFAYLFAIPEMSLQAWTLGLATGLVILLVGALLFARRWVGGGDVKLAAVAGLWAGPGYLADFVWLTSISGAILAVAMVATPLPRLLGQNGAGETGFNQPMPFGVPLALGGILIVGLHLSAM